VVLLRYQGTAGLTGLLAPPSLDGWDIHLQNAVTAVQAHVPDLALITAAAVTVVAVTTWRLRRARRSGAPSAPQSAQQPALAESAVDEPAMNRAP
jgi:hypothetical protein